MDFFAKRTAADLCAFRIAPADTNYFVVLFEPKADRIDNVFVIEIFTKGGATPPNAHARAHEFFFVLHGSGVARCGGEETALKAGDALMLGPNNEHVIENTGSSKLYTLTVMTPDEEFADLILRGTPVELDDEDRRVLARA